MAKRNKKERNEIFFTDEFNEVHTHKHSFTNILYMRPLIQAQQMKKGGEKLQKI